MAGLKARGGKKNRKWGRQKRRLSFQRYWSRPKGHPEYANRAELHAARRRARFERMVKDSRERKAQKVAA